ncbi:MAG: hypothetical protein RLZZ502_1448 [Pseudomonadota bacterium]|jgi:hypothetical protein
MTPAPTPIKPVALCARLNHPWLSVGMGLFLLCLAVLVTSTHANEAVSPAELQAVRQHFLQLGLHKANVLLGNDGRLMLSGEYQDRDEVEQAFAAARAVIGLKRLAPTSPSQINYRLKGFDSAFASTVGKMMQKNNASGNSTATNTNPNTKPEFGSAPPLQVDTPINQQKLAQLELRPEIKQRPPRTAGLLLGIGRFQYLPKATELPGADKDAQDIYNFLTSPKGGAVPPENLLLLKQEDARAGTVKMALKKLVEDSQEGDTVFLFVASHGVPNALGKFDIVLYDTEFRTKLSKNNVEQAEMTAPRRKTALTDDDLQYFISHLTLKNVRTVLVLDTCYSGKTFASVPGFLPSRTRSLRQHQIEASYVTAPPQNAINELALKAKDTKTTRIVLVAASENEESAEHPEVGGGLFTQLYLEALGKKRDYANAFDDAKPIIIKRARTFGHSQTPRLLVVPEEATTGL